LGHAITSSHNIPVGQHGSDPVTSVLPVIRPRHKSSSDLNEGVGDNALSNDPQEIARPKLVSRTTKPKVVNIMDALRNSLKEENKSGKQAAKKTQRKLAAWIKRASSSSYGKQARYLE